MKIGFCMTGSFCTFAQSMEELKKLVENGADVTPILSFNAGSLDTRFGTAAELRLKLETVTGHNIIDTIEKAEPVGPKKMFDLVVVCPCTGNTLAKLAYGITDTPVLMAVKSHLRNGRPVVLALATNDGLSGSGKNVGMLLNYKHIYFVPFSQDDPKGKPRSLVADFTRLCDTVAEAAKERQLEPIVF